MFKATLRIASILLISQTIVYGQYPSADQYIETYRNLAISEMKRTGIPASIKMGQALLESAAGTSTLATKANNHFGIKCGSAWNGNSYGRRDDEKMLLVFKKKSCFRKYNNVEESYIDHSEFIRRPNGPYSELFNLNKTDYKAWAYGLKKAGYATASDYPEKLIGIIERYHLYQLDGLTAPDVIVSSSEKKIEKPPSKPLFNTKTRIIRINQVKAIIANAGETPLSLSSITNESIDNILKYNDYLRFASQSLNQNDVVYLCKKKKSFWGKNKTHIVAKGENMFQISQLYGVRIDKLYERNHLNPDKEPAVGQIVYLRGKRPENDPILISNDKVITPDKTSNRSELVNSNEKPEIISKKQVSTSTNQIEVKRPVSNNNNEIKKPLNRNEISDDNLDFIIEPADKINQTTPDRVEKHIFTPATTNNENNINRETISSEQVQRNTPKEDLNPPKENNNFKPAITNTKSLPQNMAPSIQKDKNIPNNTLYHIVTSGDTLYNISKRYSITVEKLKSLNQLTDNNIHLGQKLKVK